MLPAGEGRERRLHVMFNRFQANIKCNKRKCLEACVEQTFDRFFLLTAMEQPLCGNEFLGRRVLVSTVNSCSTFCWPHHMAVNSSGQLKIDGVRKEKERLTAASFFWPFLVTAVNRLKVKERTMDYAQRLISS